MTKTSVKKYVILSIILIFTGIVMVSVSGLIYFIDNVSLNEELIDVITQIN